MMKWTVTLAMLCVLGVGMASAAPAGVALGDANLDGVIDAADVQFINQVAAGVSEAKGDAAWAADVNADGLVNLLDAEALQGYLDGKSTKDGKAVPVLWLPCAIGLGYIGLQALRNKSR